MRNCNLYDNIILNRNLVRIAGANAAIYWSLLAEILPRVIAKNTFDDSGFFNLDRDYVESEIGLTLKQQLDCDCTLSNLGVLNFREDDRNKIRLDVYLMTLIITADDFDELDDLKEKAKLDRGVGSANTKYADLVERSKKKKSSAELAEQNRLKKLEIEEEKKEIQKKKLKDLLEPYLVEGEVKKNMFEWVDAVIDRKSFMNINQMFNFYTALNNYSKDYNVLVELSRIAAITGYSDFQYVQNKYESSRKFSVSKPSPTAQKVATTRENTIDF